MLLGITSGATQEEVAEEQHWQLSVREVTSETIIKLTPRKQILVQSAAHFYTSELGLCCFVTGFLLLQSPGRLMMAAGWDSQNACKNRRQEPLTSLLHLLANTSG